MHSPRFTRFIQDMTALIDQAKGDETHILAQGKPLLQSLVAQDDWLDEAFAKPHPQYYQQYRLHVCPQGRFSVVSFVWGPGQQTPIHDHTVWGLIGMLRGSETASGFRPGLPGQPMAEGTTEQLQPGDVDAVSPSIGDIHRVANAYDDRVSISIHVYGADIGKVSRHVYDPATSHPRTFISGYANA